MPPRRHTLERLESRTLLDAHGVLWGADARLSLSFVPDGTNVGEERSDLFEAFESLGSELEWQEAILRGFQTWARHTNADIAVVEDEGQPLGIAGATVGDERFGDIRIAAIPLEEGLFATSVPTNELADGTWVGDVLFNSNAEIQSLDDLFAIAVHEAGHVFGLDHNDQDQSPLHVHGIPASTAPTPDDIEALQAIFGTRLQDEDEEEDEEAEETPVIEIDAVQEGTAPGFAFGDIHAQDDIDLYAIELPDSEDIEDLDLALDHLVVRLVTDEISLLQAHLTLETLDGESIGVASTEEDGTLRIDLQSPEAGEPLNVRVRSLQQEPYDVGAYTVVVEFPDSNRVHPDDVRALARTRLRTVDQEDLLRFFADLFDEDDDDELLFDDDMGSDDIEGQEVELPEDIGFAAGTRFVSRNALARTDDVDRHTVTVPESEDLSVATITLSSLTNGLRLRAVIEDELGDPVATHPIIHNPSSQIVQIPGVDAGDNLVIEIQRHPESQRMAGNYELMVRFGATATSASMPVQTVTLSEELSTFSHHLRVNRTQLFQIGIDAGGEFAPDRLLHVEIFNRAGDSLDEFTGFAAELATHTAFLPRGDHTIRVSAPREPLSLEYHLLLNPIDIPLGIEPVDPTDDPYCGFSFTGIFQCLAILGDVNEDGIVDFSDFLELSANFGKTDVTRQDGDLDGNTRVDFSDFLILSANFGQKNAEPLGNGNIPA